MFGTGPEHGGRAVDWGGFALLHKGDAIIWPRYASRKRYVFNLTHVVFYSRAGTGGNVGLV